MGSLLLIRRSSSSSLKTLALTAVSRFISENPSPVPLYARHIYAHEIASVLPTPFPAVGLTRGFHSGRALKAGFAVADYSDADEKRASNGPSDEGLEISKLGISQDITSALAQKGIHKLFPIQVQFRKERKKLLNIYLQRLPENQDFSRLLMDYY